MRIVYHVMSAPAPLGLLFMAATDRGLRYLEYLDRRSLKRAIAARANENPGATWEPSVGEMRPLADLLEQYFCGTARRLNVPLDLVGSPFQLRVWNELLKIPYGETRSYGEIAEAIGEPKAARAVGLANNQNPVPIVVPCHRVIGADGKLVGYGGGLPRKKFLLALEARFRDMLPLEGDRVLAPIAVRVAKPEPVATFSRGSRNSLRGVTRAKPKSGAPRPKSPALASATAAPATKRRPHATPAAVKPKAIAVAAGTRARSATVSAGARKPVPTRRAR